MAENESVTEEAAAAPAGHREVIWQQRRRLWCGLPWTFTRYAMTGERFIQKKGLLSLSETDVRLYRITNVSLHRSLVQRLFGLGTVHFDSSDNDMGSFDVVNIREPERFKDLLSDTVESERLRNRVTAREFMASEPADPADAL